MLSNEIINILNKDPKAGDFKKNFEIEVEKSDLTKNEKEDARRFMMMVCINNNPEAKELFTKTLYDELRNQ